MTATIRPRLVVEDVDAAIAYFERYLVTLVLFLGIVVGAVGVRVSVVDRRRRMGSL
jgi:hypothetical protein